MDVSSLQTSRCRICRCFLESEDLFCPNCGTENRDATEAALRAENKAEQDVVATTSIASIFAFQCKNCGASMSYDASAQRLRCPFCGSEKLQERKDAKTLRAEAVIVNQLDRREVEQHLREWLAQGFWKPGDTAIASTIASATAVYVPFWLFRAKTDTYWTGDQSPPPTHSHADWYALSGSHQGIHDAIMVQASSVLSTWEIDQIAPFVPSQAVAPESVDLANYVVEDFRLPRSEARMIARGKIEAADAVQCQQYIRGRSRNVRVNVIISDMIGRTLLAPVWIMVYQYREKTYRVLINGQTGKTNGTAPVSVVKISLAVLIVVVLVLAIAAVVLLSGLTQR